MLSVDEIIQKLKTDDTFTLDALELTSKESFDIFIGISDSSKGSDFFGLMNRSYALWRNFSYTDWKRCLLHFKGDEWNLTNLTSFIYRVLKIHAVQMAIEQDSSFVSFQAYASFLNKKGLYALYPHDMEYMRSQGIHQSDLQLITDRLLKEGAPPAEIIPPSYLIKGSKIV